MTQFNSLSVEAFRKIINGDLDGYLADSRAVIQAMTTPPSRTQMGVIDTLIRELQEEDTWDSLGGLWVHHTHAAQSARINWKAPSSVATVVGAPVFTAYTSYAFDGVDDYLNTGYVPAAPMTGTDIMIGVWETTNVGATTRAAGTEGIIITPRSGANTISAALNSAQTSMGANSDSRGLIVIERDGTNGRAVINGTPGSLNALSSPTSSLPTNPLFIGAYNNAGSPSTYRATNQAFTVIGKKLTDTQHVVLYDALNKYRTNYVG